MAACSLLLHPLPLPEIPRRTGTTISEFLSSFLLHRVKLDRHTLKFHDVLALMQIDYWLHQHLFSLKLTAKVPRVPDDYRTRAPTLPSLHSSRRSLFSYPRLCLFPLQLKFVPQLGPRLLQRVYSGVVRLVAIAPSMIRNLTGLNLPERFDTGFGLSLCIRYWYVIVMSTRTLENDTDYRIQELCPTHHGLRLVSACQCSLWHTAALCEGIAGTRTATSTQVHFQPKRNASYLEHDACGSQKAIFKPFTMPGNGAHRFLQQYYYEIEAAAANIQSRLRILTRLDDFRDDHPQDANSNVTCSTAELYSPVQHESLKSAIVDEVQLKNRNRRLDMMAQITKGKNSVSCPACISPPYPSYRSHRPTEVVDVLALCVAPELGCGLIAEPMEEAFLADITRTRFMFSWFPKRVAEDFLPSALLVIEEGDADVCGGHSVPRRSRSPSLFDNLEVRVLGWLYEARIPSYAYAYMRAIPARHATPCLCSFFTVARKETRLTFVDNTSILSTPRDSRSKSEEHLSPCLHVFIDVTPSEQRLIPPCRLRDEPSYVRTGSVLCLAEHGYDSSLNGNEQHEVQEELAWRAQAWKGRTCAPIEEAYLEYYAPRHPFEISFPHLDRTGLSHTSRPKPSWRDDLTAGIGQIPQAAPEHDVSCLTVRVPSKRSSISEHSYKPIDMQATRNHWIAQTRISSKPQRELEAIRIWRSSCCDGCGHVLGVAVCVGDSHSLGVEEAAVMTLDSKNCEQEKQKPRSRLVITFANCNEEGYPARDAATRTIALGAHGQAVHEADENRERKKQETGGRAAITLAICSSEVHRAGSPNNRRSWANIIKEWSEPPASSGMVRATRVLSAVLATQPQITDFIPLLLILESILLTDLQVYQRQHKLLISLHLISQHLPPLTPKPEKPIKDAPVFIRRPPMGEVVRTSTRPELDPVSSSKRPRTSLETTWRLGKGLHGSPQSRRRLKTTSTDSFLARANQQRERRITKVSQGVDTEELHLKERVQHPLVNHTCRAYTTSLNTRAACQELTSTPPPSHKSWLLRKGVNTSSQITRAARQEKVTTPPPTSQIPNLNNDYSVFSVFSIQSEYEFEYGSTKYD
ncbi:uncharacterized protein MYCFIDRAFT_180146 [Pseudocercospora fijiensis CIRAD86]|uniref:Uncharacterized protein n=1 Tax=Pseudocercospora fijiensis (strain CIRAD86) TaxID=383855 RepID=M3AIX4_PSEFD|nr:uncharacterized protein MYCFIDRAFT_180146 [Pseudocercospora fijiensis CIRAD86]EME77143.1 hypothetical protein MYCFIDRAFT_180146 [Pseudocercospora fijiensis CIRAD86]